MLENFRIHLSILLGAANKQNKTKTKQKKALKEKKKKLNKN